MSAFEQAVDIARSARMRNEARNIEVHADGGAMRVRGFAQQGHPLAPQVEWEREDDG